MSCSCFGMQHLSKIVWSFWSILSSICVRVVGDRFHLDHWPSHCPIIALWNCSCSCLRSQSLSRCLSPTVGRVPCLTTASKQWLRLRCRLLNGRERLHLQGVNVGKFEDTIKATSESTLWSLAGNAVNFCNMSQGLMAAVCSLNLPWFTLHSSSF